MLARWKSATLRPLTAGLLLSLCTSAVAENVYDALPRNTMVAARISQLQQLDRLVQPLAATFGLDMPAIGDIAASIEGVDVGGEVAIGLLRIDSRSYTPFLLLPVNDYKAFVLAGDGDAGLEYTPLTLAGEELIVSQRGRWVLVVNPLENVQQLGRIDIDTASRIADATRSESLVTVAITPVGVAELRSIASSRSEAPYRTASRRRMLASRKMNWTSLSDWEERLTLYKAPLVHLCDNCNLMLLSVDVDQQQNVELAMHFMPEKPASIAATKITLPATEVSGQQHFAIAQGPWHSSWVEMVVNMYVDHFAAGSDAVGITYFSPGEFNDLRKTVMRAHDMIQGVRALAITPEKDAPSMSNSALLLEVTDSQEFIGVVATGMTVWNELVNKSRRNVDFVFESKPLTVGDREGRRYSVDLPSAFREEDVPEVREVMDKMYGRNGAMVVDVLPVDETHVLITDLTDDLRNQLLNDLDNSQVEADGAPAGWMLVLDPAAFQDWQNLVERHVIGENAIGWKPKPLECQSKVEIEITTQSPTLTIRSTIPSDVVQAIGKLFRD